MSFADEKMTTVITGKFEIISLAGTQFIRQVDRTYGFKELVVERAEGRQ